MGLGLGKRLAHHVLPLQSDRRGLVDDDDALLVAQLEELLGVRVVRRAHAVAAAPRHQVEVLEQHRQVEASAEDVAVLMLAEAVEVEGLPIDEEADVRLHVHRADAVRQPVRVAHVPVGPKHLDLDRVQVASDRAHVARPPEHRVTHGEPAAAAGVGGHAAARDDVGLGVTQRDQHGGRARRRHEDVEVRIARVEPRRDRNVL